MSCGWWVPGSRVPGSGQEVSGRVAGARTGSAGLPTHSTGLPHTENWPSWWLLLYRRLCSGCIVLEIKEVSRELGRRFWRCGFQAFLVCVRWCHSAPYLPRRGDREGGGQKYLVWGLSTLVRVSSSCGP